MTVYLIEIILQDAGILKDVYDAMLSLYTPSCVRVRR
jgi:hypothetical protein